MLAVDDVADTPDGLREWQNGRGQVGYDADGVLGEVGVCGPSDESAEDAAPESDAATPDGENLGRIVLVDVPVVDDVDEPRADDSADDGPDGDGVDCVRVNAFHGRPTAHEEHGNGDGDER